MKCVSIVIPIYYNELNLPETIPQLISLADDLPGYALELVFVDDGSGDNSLEVLLEFQRRYSSVPFFNYYHKCQNKESSI